MGFLDDWKNVFGEEGKKARAELKEQERLQAEQDQREIFERRRNPEKMEEYESMVKQRREYIGSQKTKLESQQESIYIDGEE
jgi:hypothetical protein